MIDEFVVDRCGPCLRRGEESSYSRRRVGQGLQAVTNPCVKNGVHPRLARVDLFDHGVREGVTRDERTTDEVGSTGAELGDDAVPARSRVGPRGSWFGHRLFSEASRPVSKSGAHLRAFQAAMT
jgi:hypothetical protein